MSVKQRHAYFQFCYDWRRWSFTTARSIRVENGFATFAASGR
jgi:hypothetical protein